MNRKVNWPKVLGIVGVGVVSLVAATFQVWLAVFARISSQIASELRG